MTQQEYFVDGGTLRPDARSYVERQADHDLLKKAAEGVFCYVLTARQMGKSSLMIRTAEKLRAQGIRTAIVDLTIIGASVTLDQWYLGLLSQIKTELRLQRDIQQFWGERTHIGPAQRLVEFFHDVVLHEIHDKVAIFIDEIDTTLNLGFRDDFFAAIRAIYNARAADPVYNRLTFVLLGVASPTDLISDARRTPFNIGERIVLQGFSYDEARPLWMGLSKRYPGQEDIILKRVFYWTSGHPYMAQRLCRALVSETRVPTWNDDLIDKLVSWLFLTDEARRDPNLTFVRDRVRVAPVAERQGMLQLYRQILQGQVVKDDDRSPPNLYLKLYGLVKVEAGRLRVNNRIYERVFNQGWISEYLDDGQTNQAGGGDGRSGGGNRQIMLIGLVLVGIIVLIVVIFMLLGTR